MRDASTRRIVLLLLLAPGLASGAGCARGGGSRPTVRTRSAAPAEGSPRHASGREPVELFAATEVAAWPADLEREWKDRLATAAWMREAFLAWISAAPTARARTAGDVGAPVVHPLAGGGWEVQLGRLMDGDARFEPGLVMTVQGNQVSVQTVPTFKGEAAAAHARALATMRQEVTRRFPTFGEPLSTGHRPLHHAFVRVRPDGNLDGWITGWLEPDPTQVVMAGKDYAFLLSPDGRRVLRFRRLHRRINLVRMSGGAPTMRLLLDWHSEWEGELPTPTDLLVLLTSPWVQALATIGPRYTTFAYSVPERKDLTVRLLDSQRFIRVYKPAIPEEQE